MRISLYKEKIVQAFHGAHVLSIAAIAKKVPGADFSTIFRNVELLCKEGKLKKIIIDEDVTVYELVNINHSHDHFICNECGGVEEVHVSHDLLGKGSKAKATDVIIRGVCGPCNQ